MSTMVKVFTTNNKDKIEFTQKELQSLLDEIYEKGYADGKSHTWTWSSPYITTCGTSGGTIASTDTYTITCASTDTTSEQFIN